MKDDNMLYEISKDGGKYWEQCEYEYLEERIERSYGDPKLMLANLHDDLEVQTRFGKFRAVSLVKTYLRRGTSVFHIPNKGDETVSICCAASIETGFILVKRRHVLESMTCTNCLLGRKTQ